MKYLVLWARDSDYSPWLTSVGGYDNIEPQLYETVGEVQDFISAVAVKILIWSRRYSRLLVNLMSKSNSLILASKSRKTACIPTMQTRRGKHPEEARLVGIGLVMLVYIQSVYREINPNTFRTLHQCECDQCHIVFEREMKAKHLNRGYHYCSLQCCNNSQRSGGDLDLRRRQQFQEKLGVDYPMHRADIREKSVETCLERYGVRNVQQVAEINARSNDTFLKRLEKRQKTLGVWTSKAENKFYDKLLEYFTADDIIRQKRAAGNRCPIDFYIISIETFVQFDGVYWHGLDRPLEEIAKLNTKHDIEIYERYHRDIEQCKWFAEKGLKLIRVTDVEFDELDFSVIVERIRK